MTITIFTSTMFFTQKYPKYIIVQTGKHFIWEIYQLIQFLSLVLGVGITLWGQKYRSFEQYISMLKEPDGSVICTSLYFSPLRSCIAAYVPKKMVHGSDLLHTLLAFPSLIRGSVLLFLSKLFIPSSCKPFFSTLKLLDIFILNICQEVFLHMRKWIYSRLLSKKCCFVNPSLPQDIYSFI